MVLVVMVAVSVHQEFPASQEALDLRDQQVSRDHLQARQVHVGTKVKQVQLVPLETRVIQVLVESKVPLAPRDLKDPLVQLVPLETRVIQVLVEVKVPQVPRVLQDRLVVIGNNAFLRI